MNSLNRDMWEREFKGKDGLIVKLAKFLVQYRFFPQPWTEVQKDEWAMKRLLEIIEEAKAEEKKKMIDLSYELINESKDVTDHHIKFCEAISAINNKDKKR